MKKKRLHILTMVIGSLLALAITLSQVSTPGCLSPEKAKTEQGDMQDEKGAEAYISLPSFSLPAPFHVKADTDAYYLFEIFFEEQNDMPEVEQDPLFNDHFFQTMFRVIISPNAP